MLQNKIKVLVGVLVIWMCIVGSVRARDIVILFDVSGSMNQNKYRNLMLENLKYAIRIINTLDKGDTLSFLAFGGRRIQRVIYASMPNKRGPMGRYVKVARVKIIRTLLKRMKDLNVDTRSTDIVGALLTAERVFSEGKDPVKELYMFSDMVDTTTWNMNKSIPKPSRVKPLPDLSGVKVTVVCLYEADPNAKTFQSELYIRRLRKFWVTYLKKAGAKEVVFKTLQ